MSEENIKKVENDSVMEEKTKYSKVLPKYIPEEEIHKILAAPYRTNIHHILQMKLGVICGLRGSEVLSLIKEDININELEIRVRQGKGGKDRIVPISPSSINFVRELEKYIHDLRGQDTLFDMETTEGLTAMLKRYALRAEVDRNVTFHMLRHTFAVYSIKAGVDIRTLQRVLGHASISTTAVYLDVSIDDVKEVYRLHPLPFV